jgi:hypothetical protein
MNTLFDLWLRLQIRHAERRALRLLALANRAVLRARTDEMRELSAAVRAAGWVC